MEASPELRALLLQRRQIVEGANGSSRLSGLSARSVVSAPVRIPPQRLQATCGAPGSTATTQQPPMRRCPSAHAGRGPAARPALPGGGPYQGNGITSLSYDDETRQTFNLERRVGALTLRNEQLTQEVEKMKDKLLEDEGGLLFSEERDRLLAETDMLLAETDRMTAASQQMMHQRLELQAEASAVQASVEEVVELRAYCDTMRQRGEAEEAEAAARRKAEGAEGGGAHHFQYFEQLNEEVENLRRQNELLTAEVAALRRASQEAVIIEEVRSMWAENEELRQANFVLQHEARPAREMRLEHERLLAQQAQQAQQTQQAQPVMTQVSSAGGSEGRLRALLTTQGTTTAQLRQAIGSVEALVEEAKRELAAKQLRERRAAFERLHEAIEKEDENLLARAVDAAVETEVDQEDIEKGQAKLAQLRSLTSEERALRAMRELEARRKKDAFHLVKKDDAVALQKILDELEKDAPTVRWQDWRDYAGRTMWKCARELRAVRVQKVLGQRLGMQELETSSPAGTFASARLRHRQDSDPSTPAGAVRSPAATSSMSLPAAPKPERKKSEDKQVASPTQLAEPAPEARTGGATAAPEQVAAVPPPTPGPDAGAGAEVAAPAKGVAPEPDDGEPDDGEPDLEAAMRPLAPQEEAELKSKALRAVVQDDCVSLGQVLEAASPDIWSRWQNRAGKDLLTLSQERGSSCAYSMLAKALGILSEMKREAFEEREAVWVFLPLEVQPRRATVMEDTPEEADDVLLEYWEGDAPPCYVERCLVRRMWS